MRSRLLDRLAQVLLYKLNIAIYKLVPLLLVTVVASLLLGYALAYQYYTFLYQNP